MDVALSVLERKIAKALRSLSDETEEKEAHVRSTQSGQQTLPEFSAIILNFGVATK